MGDSKGCVEWITHSVETIEKRSTYLAWLQALVDGCACQSFDTEVSKYTGFQLYVIVRQRGREPIQRQPFYRVFHSLDKIIITLKFIFA